MKRALVLSLGFVWLLGCKSESTAIDRSAAISLFDTNNRLVDPFQARGEKATVFIFVRTDCPISNRYAPEIERVASKYSKDGIAFWLVYPDGATSPQQIDQHRRDYHLSLEALRDPRHQLVKLAKVTVTPEAAVFLADGREIYRGRIDDRYVDFGKERPAPTMHDLENALKAVAAGSPISIATTRAIGCYIE